MTGYISTAEFNSKISASLVLGIINDSVSAKLEQYHDLCQNIVSVEFFQQWLNEEDNSNQVLRFLRELYLNKGSLWFSYFYTEIAYDLVAYILHAAIIRLEDVEIGLKPQMVDKAYRYCKNELLFQLLQNPTIEIVNMTCDCLIQSLREDNNATSLTSILKDDSMRISLLRVFTEKLTSYRPFLMSHTIFIINKSIAETRLIDKVEAKDVLCDDVKDALRLTNSDVEFVDEQTEPIYLIICEALCRIFTHCIKEMAEKKSELSSDYVIEVFYYIFTIVGLGHIQWFVSDTFYSEIDKSLEKLKVRK